MEGSTKDVVRRFLGGGGTGSAQLPSQSGALSQAEQGLSMALPAMDLPSMEELQETLSQLESYRKVVEEYRKVQALQFTMVQHRVLGALTKDKLVDASLRDIVQSLKGLKEMEHLVEGKPTEIKGLVGILMELDSEDVKDLIGGHAAPRVPSAQGHSISSKQELIDVTPPPPASSAERVLAEMDLLHCPGSTFSRKEEEEERLPRL